MLEIGEMFTCPRIISVNKGAITHQSLVHGTGVRGVAQEDYNLMASENGHQSSPMHAKTDQVEKWIIQENVEVREIKGSTKEGTVATYQKAEPEKNATRKRKVQTPKTSKAQKDQTTAQKKKASKTKKLSKISTVTKLKKPIKIKVK